MSRRTRTGGRIDRSAELRFTFNGVEYTGLAGDTLASALLANDVHHVANSIKYGRPRGITAAGDDGRGRRMWELDGSPPPQAILSRESCDAMNEVLCLQRLEVAEMTDGMAPAYSTKVPLASNTELGAFLGASAFGMISILLMTFLGFAENDLDNPLFLPLAVGPILIGGLLLLTGAGLALRTVRRGSTRPA